MECHSHSRQTLPNSANASNETLCTAHLVQPAELQMAELQDGAICRKSVLQTELSIHLGSST